MWCWMLVEGLSSSTLGSPMWAPSLAAWAFSQHEGWQQNVYPLHDTDLEVSHYDFHILGIRSKLLSNPHPEGEEVDILPSEGRCVRVFVGNTKATRIINDIHHLLSTQQESRTALAVLWTLSHLTLTPASYRWGDKISEDLQMCLRF